MLLLGMGLVYAAYSLVFWGYSEVKGYSLTLGQIMVPRAYTGQWPPTVGAPTSTSSSGGGSGSSNNPITGKPDQNPNKPGVNPNTGQPAGNNGQGGPTDTGPNTLGGSPPNIG